MEAGKCVRLTLLNTQRHQILILGLGIVSYSTSMANFSAMNFTMWGGSTLALGHMPIADSSSSKRRHQFIRVCTVTPARSASSDFDIDFIYYLIVHCALNSASIRLVWSRYSGRLEPPSGVIQIHIYTLVFSKFLTRTVYARYARTP